jgi:hypothetical protein
VTPRKARRPAVDARSTRRPHGVAKVLRPRNPTLPRNRASLQPALYDGRNLIGHVRPGKARVEALDAKGHSLGFFHSVKAAADAIAAAASPSTPKAAPVAPPSKRGDGLAALRGDVRPTSRPDTDNYIKINAIVVTDECGVRCCRERKGCVMSATCLACGSLFRPQRSTARFCSQRCRKVSQRARDRGLPLKVLPQARRDGASAFLSVTATIGTSDGQKSESVTLRRKAAKLDPRIVVDSKRPGMYRIKRLDGSLSDMVNLTRARDALRGFDEAMS